MRTMAQKRAEFALERVLAIEDAGKKKDFKSFANGAPSMILQNGFGQSLAFWLAKGKDKHILLFDMVANWLHSNKFVKHFDKSGFIKDLATMEQKQYIDAQNETLAFLEWVKLFASAEL